jgi:hypothetical protein
VDFGPPKTDDPGAGTRRKIFIAAGALCLLLLAGLAYLTTRPSSAPGERRLENALRPGAPEFEQVKERVVVDFDPDENATIGVNALGAYPVNMKPTVRNFTGRTINGLEFYAAGLSLSGETIRERYFVTEEEIAPNKVTSPVIGVTFPGDRRPAQLRLELTGVRFK